MSERKCLVCGEKLLGRIDQKYCSDHCRNAYNNLLNRDSKNLVRNINNKLRKNYRILDSFPLKDGKTKTNNSGGIQGGISNGMDIYFNVAFKPVATIMKAQQTIDSNSNVV